MDANEVYRGLRFERATRSVPRRLITVGIALALFTLLWALVPHSGLYWLLLPLLAALVWIASYGWREALSALISLLYRLDQL